MFNTRIWGLCNGGEKNQNQMETERKNEKKRKRKESNSLKRRKWRIHCGNSPEGRLVQTKFR